MYIISKMIQTIAGCLWRQKHVSLRFDKFYNLPTQPKKKEKQMTTLAFALQPWNTDCSDTIKKSHKDSVDCAKNLFCFWRANDLGAIYFIQFTWTDGKTTTAVSEISCLALARLTTPTYKLILKCSNDRNVVYCVCQADCVCLLLRAKQQTYRPS